MHKVKCRETTAPDGRQYLLYSRKDWGKVKWAGSEFGPWHDSIVKARNDALRSK